MLIILGKDKIDRISKARIKFVIVVDCVNQSTKVPLNSLPQITVRPTQDFVSKILKVVNYFFCKHLLLIVCCGYLTLSGAFETLVQVMLLQIADFVGLRYFSTFSVKFSDNFSKVCSISSIPNQILVKNDEIWGATHVVNL